VQDLDHQRQLDGKGVVRLAQRPADLDQPRPEALAGAAQEALGGVEQGPAQPRSRQLRTETQQLAERLVGEVALEERVEARLRIETGQDVSRASEAVAASDPAIVSGRALVSRKMRRAVVRPVSRKMRRGVRVRRRRPVRRAARLESLRIHHTATLLLGLLPSWAAAAPPEWGGLVPGAYRLEMRQAHASKFPLLGRTETVFASVSLARLQPAAGGLRQQHRVCDVRFESGLPLVEMVMPEAMRASLVSPAYAVELRRDAQGWAYHADLGVEHVGYRPGEDPEAGLPRRREDPAVFDSDGDGKPGATLHLDVPVLDPFELYVVQRGHVVLDGRVLEGGRVEGDVLADLEQVVIGSSPYFLKRSPKLEPDRERSHFVMTPVPADSTCESLLGAPGDG
jgi:hypothetical protein